MVVPFELDKETQAVVDAAQLGRDDETPRRLLLVPRTDSGHGPIGVVAEIAQIGRLPGGEVPSRAQGHPARTGRDRRQRPGRRSVGRGDSARRPRARGRRRGAAVARPDPRVQAVLVSILQERNNWQIIERCRASTNRRVLADIAGYASWVDLAGKLMSWRPLTPAAADLLLERATAHLAELEVSERIRADVREAMDNSQREYLLRQQLAAIRKELGEGERREADDYRSRVEAADLPD